MKAEAFGPHLTAMQVAPGGCSPVDGVPVMLAVSPHSTYPYSLQHDQFHSQSFVGQPLILSALPTCSHQPYLNAYVPSPVSEAGDVVGCYAGQRLCYWLIRVPVALSLASMSPAPDVGSMALFPYSAVIFSCPTNVVDCYRGDIVWYG